MPKILEMKEIDGDLWVRLGKPGEFPSGVALLTPDEQVAARSSALEYAAEAVDQMVGNSDAYEHGSAATLGSARKVGLMQAASTIRALKS